MGDVQAEVLRDIAYDEGGARAHLDIHRPVGAKSAPVLVQVHGGGWSEGSKEEHGEKTMAWLVENGWICVAIGYRLAPEHQWPAQILDVKRAIAWVHEHIAAYGGDPARVAISGRSAGAHLAALAALTPGDPVWQPGFEDADTSVVACVPFYGVYDMAGDDGDDYTVAMRDFALKGNVFPGDATIDDFRAASPLHRITEDAPPFMVLHGDRDTFVPVRQAQVFVARLGEESRSEVAYVEVTGSGHSFDSFDSARARDAIRGVQEWLDKVT